MTRPYTIIVLGMALLLSACAVDPLHARRAAATAAAAQDHNVTCATADACAIASPYAKLAERAQLQHTHFVNLLDRGEEALLLRIHLIRAARRSIDIQTFIFAEDDAGYLVLDELVKAARRGVKVRVLVDQLFSLDNEELLAALARAHVNFELRIWHPTFYKAHTQPLDFAAGLLCCFGSFNQRMHNKLLLIDGMFGIAGGRNYENRYYDWDDEFDYRDRDVLVVGPAGVAMQASFDAYWAHEHSLPLSRLRDVSARILADGLAAAPYALHVYHDSARVAALSRLADDADFIRTRFADQALNVADVEYFADAPAKSLETEGNPSERILDLLSAAHDEIVLQTPYLVISGRAQRAFRALRRSPSAPRVLVSTNSLAATDAFYVYALSYKHKKHYLKLGFEIHEFKPFPAEAEDLVAHYAELGDEAAQRERYRKYGRAPLKRSGVRLGLHAKSIVIDGGVTLIGSHNFDPRSDRYNTESGFIIRDREFAQRVRAAILRDNAPENAWTIARREHRSWISRVNERVDNVSAKLPLFDLWPFRYASSFELKPGCAPSSPSDAHFYACHTDVGDFPEVDLSSKTIYTRIITAFGAGMSSIL